MLKRVRVEDGGDTKMFTGSLVDMQEFEEENKRVEQENLRPAEGKRGITRNNKSIFSNRKLFISCIIPRNYKSFNRSCNKRKSR